MFVVKVGEYYVYECINYGSSVGLSKEHMRTFDKNNAEMIARKTNGKVMEIGGTADEE